MNSAPLTEAVALALAKAANPGLFDGTESQMKDAALPYGIAHSQAVELKIARDLAPAAIAAITTQHKTDLIAEIIAALRKEQDRLDAEGGGYLGGGYIMDTDDCIDVIREQFAAGQGL
jgi:hypothetical protein